jgi:hypothetical protein
MLEIYMFIVDMQEYLGTITTYTELSGTFELKDIGKMKNKPENTAGGGKRSEILSVGLDPKLRYLTEIAARKHRRSLSNYIEWAIERSLEKVILREHPTDANLNESIANRSDYLWDVHEADRLAKTAINYPELLSPEEQILWKLICTSKFLWRDVVSTAASSSDAGLMPTDKELIFERIREHWDRFKAVATGEADISTLSTADPVHEPLKEKA